MRRVFLSHYRSVSAQAFDIGPLTIIFGKNNVGKTNLLEAMYGILAPNDFPEGAEPLAGLRGQGDPDISTAGAVYVDLETGLRFDDDVLGLFPAADLSAETDIGQYRLPPNQVCFVSNDDVSQLWFVDAPAYIEQSADADWVVVRIVESGYAPDARCSSLDGPRPLPLFLGWEFDDIDGDVTAALAELEGDFSAWCLPRQWPEGGAVNLSFARTDPNVAWQLSPSVVEKLRRLGSLATSLLPDFIDGSIRAEFSAPMGWSERAQVRMWFQERGNSESRAFREVGRGAHRWLSVAVQIALRIMADDAYESTLEVSESTSYSGHVLFIDEPEAHLHPSAVASVVRWCRWLTRCGFNVVAASHHEEFLRAAGDEVVFVKVSRDSDFETKARSVATANASVLQSLAADVGLHPATALSMQKAVLFVEGPLDEAVLDEYAGPELDAAGIAIVPVHGTKNLEGLIEGEFTARLGIRAGILTDNSITATVSDRSGKKRSGEEKKVMRLLQRYEAEGLASPDWFGIAEEDLLFALPAEGIRTCYPDSAGAFPGWVELREECRSALAAGPSDSVDWKRYAKEHYGLPIDTVDGVRRVVRALDLAAIPMPSIRALVDELLAWEMAPSDFSPDVTDLA